MQWFPTFWACGTIKKEREIAASSDERTAIWFEVRRHFENVFK